MRGPDKTYPPLRGLKVGDRVRLVHLPQGYLPPSTFHRDTRRLYRYLLRRKRPVRVSEIDDWGLPWIECRCRGRGGRMEYHGLLIGTESGWVQVVARKPRAKRPRKSKEDTT